MEFYSSGRKYEIFRKKMDESGKYYINQGGPDSEGQLSHVHSLVNPNF